MSAFLDRIRAGEVLVADGATGTNLQARGLTAGKPGEAWVLENPDEIARLHADFLAAGSDILLTSTFGASRMHLISFGLGDQMEEINRRAVEIARGAAQGRALVAGSMGPLGQLVQPYGPLEENQVAAAYAEQACILEDSGADLLVIETQFDLGEAAAALRGVRAASGLAVVVSFSFDRGTRTMMGVRPAQMAQALTEAGADVVGVNCGRSLEDNLKVLRDVRAATPLPLWFKPNAGLPRVGEGGAAQYDVTPEAMGQAAPAWIEAGAVVVGGCCGTTPEHIHQIARAVQAAS